jgi:hypothetical protein
MRIAQSFVIIVLGPLLSGCVFIPAKSPVWRSDAIGDGPHATIRIGETDRETVLRMFGKPSYSTERDRAFGYLLYVETGRATGLLMGPCMPYIGSTTVAKCDDVWLEFDERGILSRVEKHLLKKYDDDTEAAWRQFTQPVPDPIRREQMMEDHELPRPL